MRKRGVEMGKYFRNNLEAVGLTPLVRLNKVCPPNNALTLVKIEGRNPAYSVKDRIGVAMMADAEAKGLLGKHTEVVEPTSGNTGIALAYVCAVTGRRLTLTMPDTMSMERRKLLRILGADLVLTDGAEGMRGAVAAAEAMVAGNPEKYYMPQQFKNPANPLCHERTTGPEIWDATNGEVDVFVAGVGTGGTITGVARHFKRTKGKSVWTVAVEPEESPVISQTLAGREPIPGPHKIQGIGAGFIPEVLELGLIDEAVRVSGEEAIEFSRRLAREEGILSGISSGAAVAAAYRLSQRPEFQGKTIVAILPSAAERYLSTALFEGLPETRL
jgi:cysteine synthase A